MIFQPVAFFQFKLLIMFFVAHTRPTNETITQSTHSNMFLSFAL